MGQKGVIDHLALRAIKTKTLKTVKPFRNGLGKKTKTVIAASILKFNFFQW